MKIKKEHAPYIFISPFFILFFIFGAFPILFSLFLSFYRWDGMSAMRFVGIENYQFVLTDPWFWQSIYNTVSIAIMTTIPQHVLAIVFAYILHRGMVKFKDFFRTAYFLPYITAPVAVAMIFTTLFGSPFGILNALLGWLLNLPLIGNLLEFLNISHPIRWLGNPKYIRPAIAVLLTWRFTGWNIIIYYAGLQKIQKGIYEAAAIDGANTRQTFFKITLPLLRPIMFFALLMSIIGNMQVFDEPMILFGSMGGTNRAGLTTALYLYQTAFRWTEFGTGSAMAYVLCFFIVVASIIFNKYFRREI